MLLAGIILGLDALGFLVFFYLLYRLSNRR